MGEIVGVNILEVWNSRLSTATPLIVRNGGTWVCQIWAKSNLDYDPAKPETMAKPLEEHDTGIEAVDGDEYDPKKVAACFEWFKSRRDEYSRGNIELRKPVVAMIEAANERAATINAELQDAIAAKDGKAAGEFKALLAEHLEAANHAIEQAAAAMHEEIAAGGAS